MSWESRNGRGRYYTRSRRRGGKVVREYLGSGDMGMLMALTDALARQKLERAAAAERQRQAEGDALDATVEAACHSIELIARAALNAAGYHQHHRGEWRKRHVHRNKPM